MLKFTRFLYCYDEVKINLLLSLLKKKDFCEVIYWAAEIHCSGFDIWEYLWKIYYDFYALQSLEKQKSIKKKHDAYLKNKKFTTILNTLFILFHSKISFDVFIVNNFYKTAKCNQETIEKTDIQKVLKHTTLFYKRGMIKNFTKQLKKSLQIDKQKAIEHINKILPIELNENAEHCTFQQIFIQLFISKIQKTELNHPKNKPNIRISLKQIKYSLKLINFELKDNNFNVLKEMRHYCISEYTNSFKLEREKLDLKTNFRQNWEYYANFSPSWHKRIKSYNGKIKNRKILFHNEDDYENFYEKYNLEPDEQDLITQEKSIRILKKYKTTDMIAELHGDKQILLQLNNKIDFKKVKY
tara:strand:+ start:1057 stop:2121 length:1065 start_codon:yes stop_codon:yes gene_type:complete